MTPNDRRYVRTHEWVKIEGDTAVIGISDHAQEALGDVTFVELPGVGERVEAGKECGTIESVKAAEDLYSPLSGVVVEVNDALEESPEIINEDPYGKGWLFKVREFDPAEYEKLMDAEAYEKYVKEEEG